MKIPKYPDDFFKFGEGMKVQDFEINRWIQEAINELESCEDYRYFSKSTGDSIVIVTKFKNHYDVVVAKNYSSAYIDK